MINGILTEILQCKKAGTKREDFAKTANDLGYRMFCHNGMVYSTRLHLMASSFEDQDKAELFNISVLDK